MRDRAFQVLLKLGTRFGLDPSSREGLGVANQTSPDFAEEFLFDRTPHGKVGVSLLYKWIDARGYRDAWDHTVRFKERLRQDALTKVELDVPEIDWDLWPQECTSDAHNTARSVKAD